MFSPTPEIYIIFTALVLRLSTFIVDEVFSLSAASHIYIYIYIYLAEGLKTYLKMGQNIRTETWR